MFEPFAHYVSYGATDQHTVRELAEAIDGLVVPGTVAAFQREGTGGFVLSLSAVPNAPDYVIDPRFPLFQQALPNAKKSHRALADLLGVPELVSRNLPSPVEFSQERVELIAQNWVSFNRDYSTDRLGKFAKYAERLNEPVTPDDVRAPNYILPPYLVAEDADDPWWAVSRQLFEASLVADTSDTHVRVIAAADAQSLNSLLESVEDERVVVWVSGLSEMDRDSHILTAYGQALRRAHDRGQTTFALYGGFFSVLLSSVGLGGASHGIGYGEYRDWVELPQSGPPPARFYLPLLHRYVSQEFAYQLWLANRDLAECSCSECDGAPPVALDYHALMKHSVLCRSAEIDSWIALQRAEMADRLDRELRSFLLGTEQAGLSELIQRQSEQAAAHLQRWSDAIKSIDQ